MPDSGVYLIHSYVHKDDYLKGGDHDKGSGLVPVVVDDISKANKFVIELEPSKGVYHIRRAPANDVNPTPSITSVKEQLLYLTTDSVTEPQWFITYEEQRKVYMIHNAENHGHWELTVGNFGTQVQVLGGHEDTLSSLVRSNKAAKFLTADQAKNIDEDAFWYLTKLD